MDAKGSSRIALVLPGGGARSAYQVGVLAEITRWCPPGRPLPFSVLCGTSAGAINCAVLASHAADSARAGEALEAVWHNFHVGQVFRSGATDMLRSGLHLLVSLASAGWLLPPPRALLDTSPLRRLLEWTVNTARIRQALDTGQLQALAVTATSLEDAHTVTFVQSAQGFEPWQRAGRRGVAAELSHEHLMASSAIPLLFPPATIDGHHYSDGAIRQATPLAPALHLGAERILVIGSSEPDNRPDEPQPHAPAVGELFGFLLDALFMESLQSDLERLARINTLLALLPAGMAPPGLRRVETRLVLPSQSLDVLAPPHASAMPSSVRAMLRVLGASGPDGGPLLSYLLFEGVYTRELIALGRAEARARRDELSEFLALDCGSDQE